MVHKPLLTALESKDNNLMDLVIDELPKFHPNYHYYHYYLEDLDTKSNINIRDHGWYGCVLSEIYHDLLGRVTKTLLSLAQMEKVVTKDSTSGYLQMKL